MPHAAVLLYYSTSLSGPNPATLATHLPSGRADVTGTGGLRAPVTARANAQGRWPGANRAVPGEVLTVQTFTVATRQRRQIVDITSEVQAAVRESGVQEGIVLIAAPHCTCAIYVNENEPGLVADTLRAVAEQFDKPGWQHDRIDDNAAAHLAASFMGSSTVLPVSGGRVVLGTWQRIMLVELDGPRNRRVVVQVVGS